MSLPRPQDSNAMPAHLQCRHKIKAAPQNFAKPLDKSRGGGYNRNTLCFEREVLLAPGGIAMRKLLKISLCALAALSMFCGCKADGSLDDGKLSGLLDPENKGAGINCLSAYNSPSGNGIQLMLSNLPDGCNASDIIYKSGDDGYWQNMAWVDLSGGPKSVDFPFVDNGKKYGFYARLNHNETGKESVCLGYTPVVEVVARGENLPGEIKISGNPNIKGKYENGVLSFDNIEVSNKDLVGDAVCDVFDERWGWQVAYKGKIEGNTVSFDFEDGDLKFYDAREFHYNKGGRYNFNVHFLTKAGGENMRIYFYHGLYDSEPGYGKKGANDYYSYRQSL